jgi:fumarate reductase subunit C
MIKFWQFIEFFTIAVIVILTITEILIPLFTGKPFFGLFRKKKGVK